MSSAAKRFRLAGPSWLDRREIRGIRLSYMNRLTVLVDSSQPEKPPISPKAHCFINLPCLT
jgi:hypothetical protein